jgi:hypothetical protein
MTFRIKGISGEDTWTATPAVTPVVRIPNPDTVIYASRYPAQLTAFAINSAGQVRAPRISYGSATVIEDFRVHGERPMNPGEARPAFPTKFSTSISRNYVKGANYPDTAAIAAIYSDGTTFGDANVLSLMMGERAVMFEALTKIGDTVCRMGTQQSSYDDILKALDREHAAENTRSPKDAAVRDRAYDIFYFHARRNNVRADLRIKGLMTVTNGLRSGLAADPVKKDSGNLWIPQTMPMACTVP